MHLVEAGNDIGGCVNWISQLGHSDGKENLVAASRASASGRAWSTTAASQLDKLRNVEVITGARLRAEDVREYGAELVVVATGASWRADGLSPLTHAPIPGAERADVAGRRRRCCGRAQIGDVVVARVRGLLHGRRARAAARQRGPGVASTCVTSLPRRRPPTSTRRSRLRCCQRDLHLGVELHVSTEVDRDRRRRVPAARLGAARRRCPPRRSCSCPRAARTTRCSASSGPDADAQLARRGSRACTRSATASRRAMIADCVFDGHRLAREIDEREPERPLPFRRERPAMERQRGLEASESGGTVAA